MKTRHYLGCISAPLAIAALLAYCLTMWVDPYYGRQNLEDTSPSEHPTHDPRVKQALLAEALIDTYLLGSSRAIRGFDTRSLPRAFNCGTYAPSSLRIRNQLKGFLKHAQSPHLYFIEVGDHEGNPYDFPATYNWRARFSSEALRSTLKLLYLKFIYTLNSNAVVDFSEQIEPSDPGKFTIKAKRIQKALASLRASELTQSDIASIISTVKQSNRGSRVVFYTPPINPHFLKDPSIANANQSYNAMWQAAFDPSRLKSENSAAIFINLSTPEAWAEQANVVWNEDQWSDLIHFKPSVGALIFKRLHQAASHSALNIDPANQ
ncbi:hypothetical protein MLD52_19695 [Puniceicoccaceae bacterium K14]|nr:hypothetical protein [Puniceicoccaceae bacterium K14]